MALAYQGSSEKAESLIHTMWDDEDDRYWTMYASLALIAATHSDMEVAARELKIARQLCRKMTVGT